MTSKGRRSPRTKEAGLQVQPDQKRFIRGTYRQRHVLGGCNMSRSHQPPSHETCFYSTRGWVYMLGDHQGERV